jgi:hypothetical protein
VSDSMENSATTQWTFKVDTQLGLTYDDMPVNNATCWTCHPKNFTLQAGNVNLAGSHSAPSQCLTCHVQKFTALDRFRDCTNCHYGKFFTSPHPSTPPSIYSNLPYRQHPVKDLHLSSTSGCTECHSRILTQEHNRVDKNGNQITCDTCHTGSYLAKEISTGGNLRVDALTAKWAYGYHYLTWNTPTGITLSRIYLDKDSSLNLSDIYALFDTPNGKQWARINPSAANIGAGAGNYWIDLPYPAYGIQMRIKASGIDTGYIDIPKAMTSVDKGSPEYIRLQNAIANKDTSCTACHDNANHEQVHTDALDDKCLTCHKQSITTEHINNSTTAGKGYNCDTCHTSTNSSVQRAIVQNNTGCGSCHKTGHQMPLAASVPKDIPLNSGFTWSAPIEGIIFAGEPSAPAGFEKGQILLTDRQSNININHIWSFYNAQLTADKWILKSGAPADGASCFSAEFSKDTRTVIVRCFNTQLGDGSGAVGSVYRMEIWYK